MELDASDLIPEFDGDNLMEYQSDMFNENRMYPANDDANADADDDEDTEPEDIIAIHMHICDPIENLRTLLQERVGLPLPFPITLQHSQVLDPNKNLIEQCVNGEGIVQINAQIIFDEKRINIYDVLQPINDDDASNEYQIKSENDDPDEMKEDSESKSVSSENELLSSNDETEHDDMIKWVIDVQFKNEQVRLKIPDDPGEWTTAQVKHWLQWAVRQFKLNQIKLNDWNLTGKELCALKFPEFKEKVPSDPLNVFWTHLELLRKCKFVAVIKRPNAPENGQLPNNDNNHLDDDDHNECTARQMFKQTSKAIRLKQPNKQHFKMSNSNPSVLGVEVYQGNRSGNNGQIQLWQFLLEMLTERQHRYIIQWIGGEGEFKFVDPEKVAQLWGERKNKPTMNYEKLSRALRYYYDGDMISKVHGKRFVYKFVCNLQQLIGYNAQQLSDLVNFP